MPENKVKPRGMEQCRFPVDYFLKMFGNETFQLLLEYTNIQRVALNEKDKTKKSTIPCIEEKELRQTLGLLMYMSVVTLPNTRLFWNKTMDQTTVSKVMPRDRFEQIVSCLHLSDNKQQPAKGEPGYDKLYKVRKMLNLLNISFKSNAEMEQIVSVDEQMIPYKGTLQLKVYMKNKPSKWGIKVWALAGQSGYVHSFTIFGDNLISTEGELGIGASGQTVLNLVSDLAPGTQVFFDNYFASPGLLLALKEKQLPAACTLRANRLENCPLKTEKQLKKEGRGSMDYKVSEEGIIVVKWFDNKEVTVGSNHYSVNPTSKVRRWDKSMKVYLSIIIPFLILVYNKGMGGVDHCDQLLSFYRIKTKSRKWYRRVLYHFLDLCLVNAFILYKQMKQMPLYEFKLDVATSLMYGEVLSNPMSISATLLRQAAVANYSKHGDPIGAEVTAAVRYDGMFHLPEWPAKLGRTCKMEGCKKRSVIWCTKCRVYLCIKKDKNCFLAFHTLE